ncbi:hypothetical protein [Cellvibrio japonicus]|uniref:hypothetical protein n=1 Tax=Cellvibrio japonicus TaxID=155077 RepID=UPI0005A06DAF|nr:hypothetical protein [Cellvibrio japonicus]QEI11309.1 hypothetical protein FY117_03050 [Cellvibrio japonicus]QEI14883.1 hypothetical protein FY116_03050 [Cellvibrio japonicus]QEI18463.1 hypothetical protein FY115_03050 [Cellvibrio japonicus]
MGFFTVRKFIELNKVSAEFKAKKYTVSVFPHKELSQDEADTILPYEPDSSKSIRKTVSVTDICNQFIHSYHLIPFGGNGVLIGFFVNSTYQSRHGIYLITLFDIVEIYRLCGENPV